MTIIKTLALSQLVYLFQVLPNPPDSFIKDINSIFFNFIWNNKVDKIKREVLCMPYSTGGINMIDINYFIKGLKCAWVHRYIQGHFGQWKLFFDYYLKPYGCKFLFKCNISKTDLTGGIANLFIDQVCSAWAECSFCNPVDNPSNENIWNNTFVKINGRTVFYKQVYDRGIIKIRQLFDDTGHPLSYHTLINKYDIARFPFISYFGLIAAIPNEWKDRYRLENLITCESPNESLLTKFINSKRPSKFVYIALRESKIVTPVSISKWSYCSINFEDWRSIFLAVHSSVRETKIKAFQYKFLHRIIPTNKFLFSIHYLPTPNCSFCHIHVETLDHLFFNCPIITSFCLTYREFFAIMQLTSKRRTTSFVTL